MKFIFQMAWREMRSSWRRLLFFFISIGIFSFNSITSILGKTIEHHILRFRQKRIKLIAYS